MSSESHTKELSTRLSRTGHAISCPLCSSSNTALQNTLDVTEIISAWERVNGIDVRSEFGEVSMVELHKCFQCALEFFEPESVAGSSVLYEKLEKFEWYYLPRKWEHDAALQDMNGTRNGLEVGCGFGAFVARVIKEKGIPFEGCEQNPSAVGVAQSNGIPVRLERLEDMARRYPAAYDLVCSFQVLEHVTDPGGFLKSACELLRPGGKLILGVPNAKSSICLYLKYFDGPPHHMTRWSDEVFMRLPRWFPLELARIAYEPLPESRVGLYVEVHQDILRRHGFGRLVHPWIRSRIVRVLHTPRFRRFLRGETIYAYYVRR
jgi:SAM-dependent methyltransferase